MKTFFLTVMMFYGLLTAAQNNPIFGGGSGDGFDRRAFAQTANNIYKGGDGDGWSFGTFQQAANNIYVGAVGDGWASNNFAQAGNAIFKGGDGDGWSVLTYLQAGNNIFAGGQGDGWASTYRPLGPLPVVFLSFTAEKRGNTGLLNWQTAKEENTAYFSVERSADAVRFEKIGEVAATGNSNAPRNYFFTDAMSLNGANYYRLKQVDKDAKFVYTPTRLLLFNETGLQKLAAYPVPATTLLTVDLPVAAQSGNAALNVNNAAGVMVQQHRLSANGGNRRVLNLAGLPAGVYTLQLVSDNFSATIKIIKQ